MQTMTRTVAPHRPIVLPRVRRAVEGPLAPIRGTLIGVAIGLPAWLAVGAAVRALAG
jgi:hypothetical protein